MNDAGEKLMPERAGAVETDASTREKDCFGVEFRKHCGREVPGGNMARRRK